MQYNFYCIVFRILHFIYTTMKYLYILFSVLIFSTITYAQKEDANWIVGYEFGIGGLYGMTRISFDTAFHSQPNIDTPLLQK